MIAFARFEGLRMGARGGILGGPMPALRAAALFLLIAAAPASAARVQSVPLGRPYAEAVGGFLRGLPPGLARASVDFLNGPEAAPAELKRSLAAAAIEGPAAAASPEAIERFVAASPAAAFESARRLEMLRGALAPLLPDHGLSSLAQLERASLMAREQLDEAERRRLDAALKRIAKSLRYSPAELERVVSVDAPPAPARPSGLQAARRATPAWMPADPAARAALDARLELEESGALKTAGIDASRFFLRVRKEMQDSKRRDGDFSYRIFQPVLKRIMLDLAARGDEDLDAADRARFSALIAQGQALLDDDVPYKASMRFTFKYLEALDVVFLKMHPELGGAFHRDHAEHVLEPALDRGPDVLMFPSFRPVDVGYFVNTRPAPFHIVGLQASGLRKGEPIPFADGFYMKPSEFAWHDVGHLEFMAARDFEYLDNAGSFKPLERIVQEWDLTRRRVIGFWSSFKGDKDLYDAMELILFEILHERGYQYSFAVLKAQLDTPKWTEILMRKKDNDYYRTTPNMNMALFPRLEKARTELLRFVDESRRRDQKQHVAALYGEELAVRVTHFPKVGYGQGRLERIELDGSAEASVIVREASGELRRPGAAGLILAQVSPVSVSPFGKEPRERIGAVLAAKRDGVPVDVGGRQLKVARVVVLASKEVLVELADGSRAPLAAVAAPKGAAASEFPQDRHYFELSQALGSEERGQAISFTMQGPPKVYVGTVRYGLVSGEEVAVVRSDGGNELALPLSEVLIDPLQKADDRKPRRRRP